MLEDRPKEFSLDDHPKVDAALNKIAILAGVPDACAWPPFYSERARVRTKRDSFRSFMLVGLREARRLHLRELVMIRAAFPTLDAVDSDLEKTGLAVENLANRLRLADEARYHALEQLRLHLKASRSHHALGELQLIASGSDDDPLGAIAKILGELAKACSATRCSLQKTKVDPATSVGYQITNIKKHLGARHVIKSLIVASKKIWTGLTFSRGPYDVEGPLIDAINILKGADNFFSLVFFPEQLRVLCEDVRLELNRE